MKVFNITPEYKKIYRELVVQDLLFEKVKFDCFADGVFTFSVIKGDVRNEFSFICDDMFTSEITALDILQLKRITYFQHGIYLREEGGDWIREDRVEWAFYLNTNIN